MSAITGLVFALSLYRVWAQNDCYFAAGERAGSAIIPCGSSGFSACCQIGDLCLSDSACWNPTHNVTYMYGCTDPNYKDSTCPWKCGADFANAPYVGLDYCYNTTQNEWSCTHPPNNSESIQSFQAQQCYADSIIAFAGPSSLQPILSLPTNIGGSTVWFSQVNPTSYSLNPNYTPTTTSIMVTASVPTAVQVVSKTSGTANGTSTGAPIVGVSGSSQTTFEPTNTPASASSSAAVSASTSGLTTGAKAGIGVGVAGGVLGLAALGAVIFLFRRRSHQSIPQKEQQPLNGSYTADVKNNHQRPLSELPATSPNHLSQTQTGVGTSSTVTNWGSTAPTYHTSAPTASRPAQSTVHELA